MNESVKIVEVGARDGLQNESRHFSVQERVELLRSMEAAGIRFMEAGSFVSAKAIPQMQDSEKVWEALRSSTKAELSFLVASERGLERALSAGVERIAIFTATSDTFNRNNIRKSVEESLQMYEDLARSALDAGLSIRGYVSTVFGCPYEGPQKESRCMEVVERLFKIGCDEVSIGDTIGVAHPAQVRSVFGVLKKQFDLSLLAAHMHDTRGMAIANILAALDVGIRIFDSSVGGMGGCPYAKGSSGNVATEEVVYALEGQGMQTGISLEKLLALADEIQGKLEKPLKSKLYLSRPQRIFFDRH